LHQDSHVLIAGIVVLAVALVVLARVNLDVEQVAQAVQDLASLDVKALVLAVLVLAHSVAKQPAQVVRELVL
jgi:hypothetical protein